VKETAKKARGDERDLELVPCLKEYFLPKREKTREPQEASA
jgi:hypothetical protein